MIACRFIFFILVLVVSGCLKDDIQIPQPDFLDPELVHFDLYVELLPDTSLNLDEQSHQKYELRLLSRGGYLITLYSIVGYQQAEYFVQDGFTNHVGNYKALNLPPDTYHIIAQDTLGNQLETVIYPVKGKLTYLSYGFHIPAG